MDGIMSMYSILSSFDFWTWIWQIWPDLIERILNSKIEILIKFQSGKQQSVWIREIRVPTWNRASSTENRAPLLCSQRLAKGSKRARRPWPRLNRGFCPPSIFLEKNKKYSFRGKKGKIDTVCSLPNIWNYEDTYNNDVHFSAHILYMKKRYQ